MNKLSIGVLALVVGVIIGAATITTLTPANKLGGVNNEQEDFNGPAKFHNTVTTDSTVTIGDNLTATGDPTFADDSGTTTVTLTGNTGYGVCINTNGTSSATRVRLIIEASSTSPTGTGLAVIAKYGACN